MGIFGAMLHGFWYDLKDLVARHKLQYSSQIVETDTISLEFSGKLLRFILHTVFSLTCAFSLPNVEPRVF